MPLVEPAGPEGVVSFIRYRGGRNSADVYGNIDTGAPGYVTEAVEDWLHEVLYRNQDLDGKRVRIRLEVVDDEYDARVARALERLDLDERAAAHYPPAFDEHAHASAVAEGWRSKLERLDEPENS